MNLKRFSLIIFEIVFGFSLVLNIYLLYDAYQTREIGNLMVAIEKIKDEQRCQVLATDKGVIVICDNEKILKEIEKAFNGVKKLETTRLSDERIMELNTNFRFGERKENVEAFLIYPAPYNVVEERLKKQMAFGRYNIFYHKTWCGSLSSQDIVTTDIRKLCTLELIREHDRLSDQIAATEATQ